ncbi:FlgB family protein [Marinibacterium sp. SX1]|uniref:FlgB family protein n=1 Tax=Marinibacterium sp. SX1 TaxID=3388424 RepID=UPI003D166CB1
MFSKLTVFQTAHAMAVHAGARQALIAQNVANADTPGYRAKDLPSFSQVFAPQQHQPGTMRGTRPGHGAALGPVDVAAADPTTEDSLAPNRNGVSLEDEMVRAAEVKKDHDRALAVYRSAMSVLRMSLGSS